MKHKRSRRSLALLLALLMMVGLMTPALADGPEPPTTYTITLNANGGTVDPTSVQTDESGKLNGALPTPTYENHEFLGWFTQQSGGEQVGQDKVFTESTTIFAQWNETTPTTYAVSFVVPSGVAAIPQQMVAQGATPSDPGTPGSPAGWTFAGWTMDSSAASNYEYANQSLVSPASQAITGPTTFYAVYTKNAVTYTITLNYNDGTGKTETMTTGPDGKLTSSLPTPTWTGHTFTGWFTAASGGSQITAGYQFNGDTTIFAQWSTGTYTVTLNANGGSVSPSTVSTDSTGKLGILPTPSRTGYTFKGWFTAASGGTQVVSGQTISTNMTLYAQWNSGKYTVTFSVPSGVTAPAAQQVASGGRPAAVANPGAPLGWTFRGWTTTATSTHAYTGQTLVTPSNQTIKANTVFYAVYTRTATANVSATLRTTNGVAFSDNNTTTNGTSVLALLTNQMSASLSTSLSYVRFGSQSGTACGNLYTNSRLTALSTNTNYYNSTGSASTLPLGSVYFLPTGTSGTWSISYSAYDNYGNVLSGVLSLTVPGESVGNVTYTTSPGVPVLFNAEDFNNLLQTVYKNRTLGWVQFTSADSFDNNRGYIYYNYGGSGQTAFNNTTLRSYKFYYNDSRQGNYPLSGLSFVPGALQEDYSISLNFTAYYNSSVYVTGTLVLSVTAAAGVTDCDITYTTTAGQPVPIRLSDLRTFFNESYASYDLDYIVLRGVPATGSLYYNYNGESDYGSSRSIQLTAGTAANYRFRAEPESSREYSLSALTYVPRGSNYCVTIPFTAYSSSASRNVKGAILISVTDSDVREVYTVTTGTPVQLNADAIYNVVQNATDERLSSIQFVDLPVSTRGTLYYNYSTSGTARRVSENDTFRYAASGSKTMSDLTFVPRGAGSVTLPYLAYNSSGRAIARGTVAIGVVTRVVTYSDVSSSSWYYKYVTELSDAGVINGMPDGSYAGNRNVTYGEALKLILLATGYPEQPKQVGKHWAAGYLELAQTYGFLTGNVALDEPISRQAVASLAANAMRLRSYPSMSPFADTSDVSVLKLYEAGIVEGSYGAGGNMYFYPRNTITRAEVATIVWRIYNASR